jgi:cysteine desulfurase
MKCALEEPVAVVSIMHVNNEIGTINDVALYARLCRERGVLIHTDAVQSAGHLELDVRKLGVDLLTLSGHKFYGPKGVGLLYVRAGTPFEPVLTGGAQERGRRSGTEDVAGIVGLSRALALACDERAARSSHLRRLQARLMDALRGEFRGAVRINTPDQSDIAAPHIVSIAIPPVGGKGVDAEMLLLAMDLDGINLSSGSACASGSMTPSHVLSAIGLDEPTAAASLRFSFGVSNSEEHVDYAVERLGVVLRRMGITDSGMRSADRVPG